MPSFLKIVTASCYLFKTYKKILVTKAFQTFKVIYINDFMELKLKTKIKIKYRLNFEIEIKIKWKRKRNCRQR